MEVTVKVMFRGRVIDSITRPLRSNGGQPAVTYKKLLCTVVDGCINIDPESSSVSTPQLTNTLEWPTLVAQLLPTQLPVQRVACIELLHNSFKKALPVGVVQAVSSLVSVDLEEEARELLVDFLREKYDSEKLLKELQSQPLLKFSHHTSDHDIGRHPAHGGTESDPSIETFIEDEHSDWDWTPASEIRAPSVNDFDLRQEAERLQQTIGAFRASEQGTVIPNLNEPIDQLSWMLESTSTQSESVAPKEITLVERTVKLGNTALDLLRYFADNPGDRAAHAELVLGYPIADINKFLSGSLSNYLKRSGSGGWECHPWTHDVLTIIDEAS